MTREELQNANFMNYGELLDTEDCAVKDNGDGSYCLAYEHDTDTFHMIAGINPDVFIQHCNIFKDLISGFINEPFDEWLASDISDCMLDILIFWNHGKTFLYDCTPDRYPLDKVPCPTRLPDGRIDMREPLAYLWARASDQEKRSYTKNESNKELFDKHHAILAKLWGFNNLDEYYTEKPYAFSVEDVKCTLPREVVACVKIHLGKSPNGLYSVSSSIMLATEGCGSAPSVYNRYAYPDRDSALRAEIQTVRTYLADKKQDKYKSAILAWLDSLESDMMQPLLFAM